MKQYKLDKNQHFKNIKKEIKNRLKLRFKCNWIEVLKKLESGRNYNFKNDLDFMTKIEFELTQILKQIIKKSFKSIEFPANIRISHNKPPKGYLQRPYATDNIHQDSWSGEPSDSYIFFMYIFLYKKCSYMKMFYKNSKLNRRRKTLKSYKELKINENDLKKYDFSKKSGNAILFDTNTPHKSVRGKNGIRISLDVRFRLKNPYIKNKKIYSIKEFSTNKILKQGKFWHPPTKKLSTFKNKLNYEYEKIQEIGNAKALNLRNNYLKYFEYQ